MQPSIPTSKVARVRLKHLRKVHKLVTSVLQAHKDDMQARSQPSTSPQLLPRDKVSAVTNGLFLRGQLHKKLKDIRLGAFTMLAHIVANNYKLELPSTI
jgi:hypothetical protein